MVTRIEQWSVKVEKPHEYKAPELCLSYLEGDVTGHPKLGSGRIDTSTIASVSGRLVTTVSGTVYELGEPHPDYVAWCAENGITLDPAEPVRVRR